MDFLADDVPEQLANKAALLVSELTTNVVRHAHTMFSLCADVTPFGVRVEVADGTRHPPVLERPESNEPGGRGLMIVSYLADNWGSKAIPHGKLVWFELSLVGQ